MRKIGNDIEYFIAQLSGDEDRARIAVRAHQVRDRFKEVLCVVYGETAQLFLAHTNNVYIMSKNDVKTLIVYVDESIFAAELNAQRELIKLKLLQLYDEKVEEFEIYVSRGKYKKNHPYLVDESAMKTYKPVPLDERERQLVSSTAEGVDSKLQKSFQKAMTAALELNKSEKGETR